MMTILILILLCLYGFLRESSMTLKMLTQILTTTIIFMIVFWFFQRITNVYLKKRESDESFSFAFWMFLGVIATLLAKGSLLNLPFLLN